MAASGKQFISKYLAGIAKWRPGGILRVGGLCSIESNDGRAFSAICIP
jgi:hypothetical protein